MVGVDKLGGKMLMLGKGSYCRIKFVYFVFGKMVFYSFYRTYEPLYYWFRVHSAKEIVMLCILSFFQKFNKVWI